MHILLHRQDGKEQFLRQWNWCLITDMRSWYHEYNHSPDRAFDLIDPDEQIAELKRAKDVIKGTTSRSCEATIT